MRIANTLTEITIKTISLCSHFIQILDDATCSLSHLQTQNREKKIYKDNITNETEKYCIKNNISMRRRFE